jgi:hypothetical protein
LLALRRIELGGEAGDGAEALALARSAGMDGALASTK